MSQTNPRPAATYAEAQAALLSRWPEHKLDPTLERIADFCSVLGDPQTNYDVVHITGTNGKTSTARMAEQLLITMGLRTGRFTSPHLTSMTERISLDGEPISEERFVDAFNDIAPYTHVVDGHHDHPLSFFETVVGMAYAAFADAPVDVAIVEVGMGGAWDATNVADGAVSVLTPIGLDHAQYLGDTIADIAREKVGIIKPGAVCVSAEQHHDAAVLIEARCAEVGATLLREGVDFSVVSRTPAVGGQVISLRTPKATYSEVFVPLYGGHQAQNALMALVAVESLIGASGALDDDLVREAFAEVTSPGRLEIVRRSPTIILDAAHNPHGAAACVAALEDSFLFDPLVGVMGVMGDKDVEGVLAEFEPVLAHLVCTQNSQSRSMSAHDLAQVAREVFGPDRVSVAPDLVDAIDQAAALAEAGAAVGNPLGGGGVLVTGSVVTVGEARAMLMRGRK
jgi:dihydrofolate synthase/folylpolyglutamate synthase